jgi:hypothetical protein
MPVHPLDEFLVPPILFVDETFEFKQNLFFVGALAFKSVMAILAVARHIQILLYSRRHTQDSGRTILRLQDCIYAS